VYRAAQVKKLLRLLEGVPVMDADGLPDESG
jgi:hypothetical protein